MTSNPAVREPRRNRLLSTAVALCFLAWGQAGLAQPFAQDPAPKPAPKPEPQPKPEPPPKPVPDDGHGHDADKKADALIGRQGQPVDPNAKLAIEFGDEKYDLGTIRQGEKREHVFHMTSAGTSPLVISQAKPTCGCTLGEVRIENDQGVFEPYHMGDPISPGRKIDLAATIDTTNKHGATQVRINVYTNDPVGNYQLALSANVESFLTVTPAALMFGDLAQESVKEGVVSIRTPPGEPVKLEITDAQGIPKPKGLEYVLTPVEPDQAGRASMWHLKVNLGPGLEEGQLGYRLTLATDVELPGGKELPDGTKQTYNSAVSISARVLGALTCTPMYFSLGLVRPGLVVLRTVKLTSNDPSFELADVRAEIRGFDNEELPWKESFSTLVRPVPGENAVEIELKLDALPESADGTFKGQVVIHTGHPQKPEIPVSFSGVARAGVTTTGNPPPKGTKIVPPPTPEDKKSGGQ